MLLTLITGLGILISIVLLIMLISRTTTYKQYYLTTAPRDRDQRRDFNESKRDQVQKMLNLLLVLLAIIILTVAFAYLSLRTQNENSAPKMKAYKEAEWKIDSLKWNEISGKTGDELVKVEHDLATNLASFLGPNTVVLQPGSLDNSLTVSVTSFVPSEKQVKLVKKNFTGMIEDSHELTEIKVFDFSFGFYDENQQYGKESIVYFREKSQNDLIKLE